MKYEVGINARNASFLILLGGNSTLIISLDKT